MIRDLTNYERKHNLKPIYCIVMMEKSGADPIKYMNDENVGLPDIGKKAEMGFFYDKDLAFEAMHTNSFNIHERLYNYGYVIMQFPGLYQGPRSGERQYFKWDENSRGFFEDEERDLIRIISL